MKEAYNGFYEKRMHIFSELVRRYWNGELDRISDLEDLAQEIRSRYGFGEDEVPFIKDHIRLAMGLDPNGSGRFSGRKGLLSYKLLLPRVVQSDPEKLSRDP